MQLVMWQEQDDKIDPLTSTLDTMIIGVIVLSLILYSIGVPVSLTSSSDEPTIASY